jgi:hypothetical protein
MAPEPNDITRLTSDAVAQLLLRGRAETTREAEELYLNPCLPEVVRLLESGLSDEELEEKKPTYQGIFMILDMMNIPWCPAMGGTGFEPVTSTV